MLIIGLGNPGKEYENTRHNLGFYFIDKIKESLDFPDFKMEKKYNALISKKGDMILAKPQTFMNRSGESVKKLLKNTLLVIHDEVDVKLGQVKISKNITSHGHNGVESIINNIKTKLKIIIKYNNDNKTKSKHSRCSTYCVNRTITSQA